MHRIERSSALFRQLPCKFFVPKTFKHSRPISKQHNNFCHVHRCTFFGTSFLSVCHPSVILSRIGMKFDRNMFFTSHLSFASIDGVGLWMCRHNFKMAVMASFHAEKCCHLVSVSVLRICSSRCQFLI